MLPYKTHRFPLLPGPMAWDSAPFVRYEHQECAKQHTFELLLLSAVPICICIYI